MQEDDFWHKGCSMQHQILRHVFVQLLGCISDRKRRCLVFVLLEAIEIGRWPETQGPLI